MRKPGPPLEVHRSPVTSASNNNETTATQNFARGLAAVTMAS
jgi:hypothetical protein